MTLLIRSSLLLLMGIFFCAMAQTACAADPDSLRRVFEKARIEDKPGVLNEIINYYRVEKPDTVIALSEKLLELGLQLKDSANIYRAYNFLGVAYASTGNLDKALANMLKSLDVAAAMDDLKKISAVHNNLSYIYFLQKQYDKAINSLEQSMQIDRKRGDLRAVGITYNNLGIMYRGMSDFTKSEESYRRALEIGEQLKSDTAQANTLTGLADLFYFTGDYKRSLEYIDRALRITEPARLDFITNVLLYSRARSRVKLGDWEKAKADAERAITIAKRHGFRVHVKQGYQILVDVLESSGQYAEALKAFKSFKAIEDSIFQHDKSKELAAYEAQLETNLKTFRIAQLQKENELQQRIFVWTGISAVLFCLALVFILLTVTYRNRMLRKANEALVIKHETEQKITRLEREKLELDLEYKDRQIVSNAMIIAQKNDVLKELKERVKKIDNGDHEGVGKELKGLVREITNNIELSNDWNHIKLHFEQVHPDFFTALEKQWPNLTIHEQKLCVYIRMKMTNKEISRLLNITPDSVKVLKYRLKKKMTLQEEENLQELLHAL